MNECAQVCRAGENAIRHGLNKRRCYYLSICLSYEMLCGTNEYAAAHVKNKSRGYCELALDFSRLDYGKIRYGSAQKLKNYGSHVGERPFIPFSYDDGACKQPNLALLMPAFKVHAWDAASGRLELDFMDTAAQGRVVALQNYVLGAVVEHQRTWLGRTDITLESAAEIFQPFIQHGRFVIYLPNSEQKKQIWIHDGKEWGLGAEALVEGAVVRPVIKLQGLCFILNGGGRMKFRIQHQSVTIFVRI